MASVLREADRDRLLRRIGTLTPASRGRWGRMHVGQMLGHLGESARMALGDLAVRPKGRLRAFQAFPLKHLMLYVVPFPKGLPTASELLAAPPAEFEAERARLCELMTRLGSGPHDGPGPVHPFFGPLSRRQWGVLAWRHADHHLRQFGA